MPESDRPFALSDPAVALALLSRWPLHPDAAAMRRGARTAWSWPLVGLALGGLATGLAMLTQAIGISKEISALLALTLLVIQTGALHEDGLADVADGFWGGFERSRRLEIMRDSRVGTYGVLALIVSLGLRGVLLAALSNHLAIAILVPAALSRTTMALVMQWLPNARNTGLSHSVGRPGAPAIAAACILALLAALLLGGWATLWAILAALVGAIACARIAMAKIAGQTGDVLGATQQVTEIASLLALAATL